MKPIIQQLDEAFGIRQTRMQKYRRLRKEIAEQNSQNLTNAIVELTNEIHKLNETLKEKNNA